MEPFSGVYIQYRPANMESLEEILAKTNPRLLMEKSVRASRQPMFSTLSTSPVQTFLFT
jgi:hypothetical protein